MREIRKLCMGTVMDEERAQRLAHNIHRVSIGLFELAVQMSNIMISLQDVQTRITDSAILIKEIVDDLPEEVQEKTTTISMGELAEKKIEAQLNPKKVTLVGLIRRILGGGNSHE